MLLVTPRESQAFSTTQVTSEYALSPGTGKDRFGKNVSLLAHSFA